MPDELLGTVALKARGWTGTLIRRFLPTPDRTKVNPHYRSGPPMRLYDLARVEPRLTAGSRDEWLASGRIDP
jgi:hypothetical protein